MICYIYRLSYVILTLTFSAYWTPAFPQGAIAARVTNTDPDSVVIFDVQVDVREEFLAIHGANFDDGLTPIVTFDGKELEITGPEEEELKPNLVIVSLPHADTYDGSFLITVKTGDYLENFDSYNLTLGDKGPVPPADQLLIDSATATYFPNLGVTWVTVAVNNFGIGAWQVWLAETELVIETAQSSDTFLLASAPGDIVEEADGAPLVTVQTGLDSQYYDIILVSVPVDDADFSEYWKECPFDWKDTDHEPKTRPKCYQLVKDFQYDLKPLFEAEGPFYDYFSCLPDPRINMVFGPKYCIGDFMNTMGTHLSIKMPGPYPEDVIDLDNEHDKMFFRLEPEGVLNVKKGYRWDGPTPPGAMKKPQDYEAILMQATIVHDTLYDLMRDGQLESDCANLRPDVKKDGYWNQLVADNSFYSLSLLDSHSRVRTDVWWYGIRIGGYRNTCDPHAPWKRHALAEAGTYEPAQCAPKDGAVIELDASESKYADKFEWKLDGEDLNTGKKVSQLFEPGIHDITLEVDLAGEITEYYKDTDTAVIWVIQDKAPPVIEPHVDITSVNDPGKCSAVIEFDIFASDDCGDPQISCTHGSGTLFPVGETTVQCTATDIGSNKASTDFVVTIHDVEPPVITGISKPILVQVRNHKYATFTPGDFVNSVTDNCTPLSPNDLVFTQITSSEPENVKGDGHTVVDFVIAPDRRSVKLRLERRGKGTGRTYSIDIEAEDGHGNAVTESFQVQVLHDQRN